jgi:hypothetical protein
MITRMGLPDVFAFWFVLYSFFLISLTQASATSQLTSVLMDTMTVRA